MEKNKLNDIKELLSVFEESNLTEFEYSDNEFAIKFGKNNKVVTSNVVENYVPKVEEVAVEKVDNFNDVKSPIVGTFYAASAPDKPAYVKVGDKVKAGQVLCIVEAMKLMNEISSPFDGEVVEILVEDGQGVEFNQVLFKIK